MNNHISDIEESPETPQNELGEAESDAGDNSKTLLSPWDQVKSEWSAPVEKRALLVRSMTTVTVQMVELATDVAKRYGLPISGVNMIPSKAGPRPYINSDGIRWRLHMDKRGLKEYIGEITHMPTDDEPYIMARSRVEMKDGTIAVNEAIMDWPATGKDAGFTLGDAAMKAITKAKRRAGADMVGVGLPLYDEYYDEVAPEVIEGNWKVEKPQTAKKTEPTNLSELINMATELGIDYEDLPAMMGVADVSDLNIEETWNKIRSEHEATVPGQESEA